MRDAEWESQGGSANAEGCMASEGPSAEGLSAKTQK